LLTENLGGSIAVTKNAEEQQDGNVAMDDDDDDEEYEVPDLIEDVIGT